VSARRLLGILALAATVLGGAAGSLHAQDSVLVRVGGELAATAGHTVEVPVTVDLSAAPGRALGAYQVTARFDPTVFQFYGIASTGAGFAAPSVNSDSVYSTGRLLMAAVQPSGATGNVLLFNISLYVQTDTVLSPITLTVTSMTATAGSVTPFEDLLPLVRVVNGSFCGATGLWGDVDGDGAANSRDALMALSAVVGLQPPVGAKPGLADVDADGAVTSRDALIILSYAVGLPVTGFRVLLPAAGPACATGAATHLALAPDTLDLVSLQSAQVSVTATDSTGRAVPTTGLIWRSLDPSVAVFDPNYGEVIGHGAGTTRLIAELGPGVADTMVVNVLARRTNWYVDVRRARNVITQTGSSRAPMQFIGDALNVAADGDTIRVAGGVYEEVVYANRAVAIIGDSLDRPVLDPRGDPYYNPMNPALTLSGGAGAQTVAFLHIAASGAYILGGAVAVHHVDFDSAADYALWIKSEPDYTVSAPGLGQLGNVLVDSVRVGMFASYGVRVEAADTVEIRRSRVLGQVTYSESCSGGDPADAGNFVVSDATRAWVHDNVVDGGPCQGIGVYVSGDRAVIQRNQVRNTSQNGIVARGPLVELDHNAVRTLGRDPNASYYDYFRGIWIARDNCYYCSNPVVTDSVVSVADTVVDIYSANATGFGVDTVRVAVIDQLRTDSIGTDTSYTAAAVSVGGSHLTLTNSRIVRTGRTGLEAMGAVDVFTRGNRFDVGESAIAVTQGYYNGHPDTVAVVGDTITGMRYNGITVGYANFARVDSTLVDSAGGTGVYLEATYRALVARSSLLRAGGNGLYGIAVDTLSVIGDTIQNSGGGGLQVSGGADTVRISHTVITSGGANGLDVYSRTARLDSTVLSGNSGAGFNVQAGAGALIRSSRIESNGLGLTVSIGALPLTVVRQSRIAGNLAQQGARNDNFQFTALDADSVWWGASTGPSCDSTVVGAACVASAADSVLTPGIIFANFLTAVPPTPAPPAIRPVARRQAPRAATPATHPSLTPRPAPTARAPVSPRRYGLGDIPQRTWQRGRTASPPAPPHRH